MLERPISKAGWTRVRFDQIATQINDRVDNPAEAGVERYVGLEHLDPDNLRIQRWGEPSDVESTKLRFQPGDIIFGKRRVYQRKVAVADFEGICSAHAMVLRAKTGAVLTEFLPFFMQSDLFMERALSISVGSLSPTINWKALSAEEFLLPPIQEQARLVDILSAIADGKHTLNEVVNKARLAHSSLVDHVLGIKLSRGRIEYTREAETRLVRLDDLLDPARPLSYGILIPGPFVQGGVPMLRIVDFDDFGRRSNSEIQIVAKAVADTSKSTYLRAGDLLLSVVGTIGRTFIVPPGMEGWNVNRALALLSQGAVVSNQFLEAFFAGASINEYLAHSKVGSAQPRINLEFLREILVPIPSEDQVDVVIKSQAKMREAVESAVKRIEKNRELSSAIWLAIEK